MAHLAILGRPLPRSFGLSPWWPTASRTGTRRVPESVREGIRRADDAERSFQEAGKREVQAGDESERTGRGRRRGRLAIGRQMSYDVHGDRKTAGERRREQVRHLVRSVGVELEDGVSVPFFVEPVPGRFRRNPSLKAVDVKDEQLRTLEVPAEVPAKIPSSGLPLETLKHLIEIGLRNGDDL